MTFSDYIVYVDESGDHGLSSVDPDYPVFVLAFCVFEKRTYTESCAPALQRLKFKHWGHDMVVLHERDIRKASGEFSFLVDSARRDEFMADVNELVECSDFTVIASAIEKRRLQERYGRPENPYELALEFCLERLWFLLKRKRRIVHVVFESRGRREDEELELEFRRICAGENYRGQILPFEPVFASKKANCGGLQIADLIARPIGRAVLDPEQANRAYDVIEPKLYRYRGRVAGAGLKIFP